MRLTIGYAAGAALGFVSAYVVFLWLASMPYSWGAPATSLTPAGFLTGAAAGGAITLGIQLGWRRIDDRRDRRRG